MVCGLIAAVVLARGSVVKAIGMVALGLLLGLAGTDVNSGIRRFTFGMQGLADGIEFVAISMAIYGIGEVVYNLEQKGTQGDVTAGVGRVWPAWEDIRICIPSILRGTILGSLLGVLPGGGALLAAFGAYTLEKKVAKPPRNFGQGDIRGVAAPESANNAGAQTSFIPMLTLGIPSNPTMAMMIGALMIHGISPGPRVLTERPELFWGVVASMWIGNLMLVILNLPLVGIWVKLLRIPYRLLFPAIIGFCCVGAFTVNSNMFDVLVMAFFSVFGNLCLKLECEPAPLILGFVLGPLMEENMRRALLISRGDPRVFVEEPISLAFLIAAAGLLLVVAAPAIRKALPHSEHRRHKGLNNRAENSHLPTRKRERVLQRFKSAEHAQRFLVPFSAVSNHFRPRRHRLTASTYRQFRTQAHTAWHDVTQAGVRH
jgi:TctA family transporter